MVFPFNQIAGFVSRLGNVAKEIPPARLTFDTHPLRAIFKSRLDAFVRASNLHGNIYRNEEGFARGLDVSDWSGFYGWGATNTPEKAMASTIRALGPQELTDLQRKMLLQGVGTTREAALSSVAILNHRNELAGIARENLDKSAQKRERIGRIMDALSNKQVALRQRIEADVAQANAPVPQARQGIRAGIKRFFGFQN